MRLAAIDFETTGLDTANDKIIEVGAVLWDVETQTPLRMISEFIDPMDEITPEITGLTGITNEMVQEFGFNQSSLATNVAQMITGADYAVAHYAVNFDKPIFEATCKRTGVEMPSQVWLDTSIDVLYPMKTRNLKHLAAEHGFLNPFPHRALFDVLTMLRILSQYDIQAVIARAMEPTVYVEIISDYKDKETVKARGYRWQPEQKIWWKAMKSSDYVKEQQECGFPTRLLLIAPE